MGGNVSKRVVLFEKDKYPRIYKNPPDLDLLKRKGRILVNPKFPEGVPPHLWKIENGEIGVLKEGEKAVIPVKINWPLVSLSSYSFLITALFLYIERVEALRLILMALSSCRSKIISIRSAIDLFTGW